MSGDFEPWDNSPAKNEAPKPEVTPSFDYRKEIRAERIRVLVWILAFVGGFIFMWYARQRGWLWWR